MIQDFRFALRQLWKAPSFTIAAVAVLALGIGTNTAIFSLVNVMLFAPPSYKRPAEIVQLFSQDQKNPKSFRAFSYPTYCDVRDQNTVFSGVLAHSDAVVGLGEKGNILRATADMVSANYFSVLGVLPAYGRSFLPEEEKPGRDQHAAIVSYGYWQKQSRDPTILGRSLLIDGRAFNDHFWFFFGSLSDVQYAVTAVDTTTGASRIYANPQGHLASIADTSAF